MFGKPKRVVIHNWDPSLVNYLVEKYGKPKAYIVEGEEITMEW